MKPPAWPGGAQAALSLSWDDGRSSQVDHALPVLEEFGVRGTFYVLPSAIDQRLDSWRRSSAAGHEIGNHTVRHPCAANHAWVHPENALENYTLARMEAEILEANAALEERIGVRPQTFAYCCRETFVGRGAEVASYVPVVARHFVVGRLAASDGCNIPGRFDLAQTWSTTMDNQPAARMCAQVDAAVARGGWLIFNGHELAPEAAFQTTSTEALRDVLRYARNLPGLWIDTVAAVGRHHRATLNGNAAPTA